MTVRKQIVEALESRKIFTPNQYGFRRGGGTEKCLMDVLDEVQAHQIEGEYVALVAADGTAAFDAIDRNQIKELISMTGAETDTISWISDYFEGRQQYVEVSGKCSSLWKVDIGSVQGSPISPDFYNVTSVTQTLWNGFANSFQLADDNVDIVHAETEDECNKLVSEAAKGMCEWFDTIGLTVNPRKSEVLGFGFTPNPVVMAGHTVHPSQEIKFLGLRIAANLRWSKQVEELCASIRRAAGRIRFEGRNLTIMDRRILYHGWIGGRLNTNMGAYMSMLTEKDINKIQVACNTGLRAVLGFPRRGADDLSSGRKKLGIPTVKQIIHQRELLLAWEHREELLVLAAKGRATRRQEIGDVIAQDQRGKKKHLSKTRARLMWNQLPAEVRETGNRSRAKHLIRRVVGNRINKDG